MEHNTSDINDVRPTSLGHLVGQESVKQQVSVALDAAFADQRPMDHSMMIGPAGVGKTTVAQIIAQELATELIEVLGQNLAGPAELNTAMLSLSDKRRCLLIDECHEIPKRQQTALLLALDQKKIVFQGLNGFQAIKLPNFCLMLATTDPQSLIAPLVDRMRLVLRFRHYTEPELAQVVCQRSRALGWDVHEAVLPEIARRGRGTPRAALRILLAARRCARAEGETTIRLDHLRKACKMESIDDLGLGPTEQEYLRILADGTTRLNVAASMLGLAPTVVSRTIEPFLLRVGLIVKDDQGRRQLTAIGRERASRTCPETV